MTDEQLAKAVHDAVSALNQAIGEASRNGLKVEIDSLTHYSMRNGETDMVTAEVFRRLRPASGHAV